MCLYKMQNHVLNRELFLVVKSTGMKLTRVFLSFRFFDYLMEQALKKVLLEYIRAMLSK